MGRTSRGRALVDRSADQLLVLNSLLRLLKKSEPKSLLNSDSTDENESESNEKSLPKLKLELKSLVDEPDDSDERDESEESNVKSGPQFFFPNSSMFLSA